MIVRLRECEEYILHVDNNIRDELLDLLKVKSQPNQVPQHRPNEMDIEEDVMRQPSRTLKIP